MGWHRRFAYNQSIFRISVIVLCFCVGIISCNWLQDEHLVVPEDVESTIDLDTNESIEQDKSDVHTISTNKLSMRLRSHHVHFKLRALRPTEYITFPADLTRIHNPKTGPPASLAIATDAGVFSEHMAKGAIDAEKIKNFS